MSLSNGLEDSEHASVNGDVGRDDDEPVLLPSGKRLVVYPIVYSDLWSLYKKAQGFICALLFEWFLVILFSVDVCGSL